MSAAMLPTKLGKEPLIDVIFEIRYRAAGPISGLLPGLFFSQLKGVGGLETLPASQIPEGLRSIDPNLKYAGLTRLQWERFVIVVGEGSLAVGCNIPYAGWEKFRAAILQAVGVVATTGMVKLVERASMKYTDFFPTNDMAEALKKFQLEIKVGNRTIASENTQLRVEIPDGKLIHAVNIFNAATLQKIQAQSEGPVGGQGAILDVDTLALGVDLSMDEFMTTAPGLIDDLHAANKRVFFECLSPTGLGELEPSYE